MDYKLVGKRIRRQRYIIDMTQEKVAEKANITTKYYSNIERGTNKGRLETYYNIAQALGVSLDSLTQDSLEPSSTAFSKLITEQIKDFNQSQKAMLSKFIDMLSKYEVNEKSTKTEHTYEK